MQSINRFLYGPTPEERVRKWQSSLRAEQRRLDREMRQLNQAKKVAEGQVKSLASKGDTKNAKVLAREIVKSRKQLDRMSVGKAKLGSIDMQLKENLATIKVTGIMNKSTEIMKICNSMVKLGQFNQTMQNMSMEMTKAGIMSEMIEEAMEGTEDDELEEEADAEVDKVLFEITDGKLGEAKTDLPALSQTEDEEVMEAEHQDLAKLQQQLNQLLSG
ncbi:hypothetical protein SCHPADRAFT_908766 [Schizopora paradoxa]|uniref:Snf7-domain-containing protein n=1 Tax=Schizopora paradoxa TaxID=27342 RepID=A0A0H2R8V3_9AGAM|nr:hypothetical protein SCHPADRAFT_908766 [Schizopora paradoxa]